MVDAGQRVLGRIRLSRLTDESTSKERQQEVIEQWSQMNGHTIVGWAEDMDVSRSVDPFDTPALGEWLTKPEKVEQWDIVATWKLDRLATGSIYLNKMMHWCFKHGKVIVSVTENFDLSTWVGRMIANVIAGVAEGELEAIKERTKASRKKLVESGRWPGGKAPYGYRPVKLDDGGWALEINPEQEAVILRAAAEIIDGAAFESVAKRLREEGVPTPRGGTWAPSVLKKMLMNKSLLGHSTYRGETVRDAHGNPVLISDPIFQLDEWNRLQAAAEARTVAPRRTRQTSPLLGIVKCWECEENLAYKYYRTRHCYYHCRHSGEHTQMMRSEDVEKWLEEEFLLKVGDELAQERVYVPAENHRQALDEAAKAVDELAALLATVSSDTMRTRLLGQLGSLDAKISELEKMPSREAGWELREMDYTYRDAWERADTEGKRQLLLRSEITAQIKLTDRSANGAGGAGMFHTKLNIPEDILERLAASRD